MMTTVANSAVAAIACVDSKIDEDLPAAELQKQKPQRNFSSVLFVRSHFIGPKLFWLFPVFTKIFFSR